VSSAALRSEHGLTLTELIVVSFVLIILTGLIWGTFATESRVYRVETARGTTISNLRLWTARMVKDIRNANYDPLGTAGAAISTASPQDFEFTVDFDKNGAINTSDAREKLGYRLNGTSLQLLQATTWRTIVSDVSSLTFTYWDYQGNQVNGTSPYSSFQDIAEVRMSITAEADEGTFSETGRAYIRNPNSL